MSDGVERITPLSIDRAEFGLPDLPIPDGESIEIRRNPDGTIDEVLLYVDERCVFHLEQNSKRSWYFGLYPDGEEMEQFFINAAKRVTIISGRDT